MQYGDITKQLQQLSMLANPINFYCDDIIDPLTNLDLAAAQIAALDSITTIHNSTAHLAGALGIATDILVPKLSDWRWGLLEEQTRWYEKTTVYRQQCAGD